MLKEKTQAMLIAVKKRKKTAIIVGLLILTAIAGLMGQLLLKPDKASLTKATINTPKYFVPEGKNLSLARAQDAGQVPTAKNEELQDGVKYTLDKPHLEAVKEVMQQMKQGGFVAQGGSYQDQQKTVMRMNNSSETLIITVIQPDLKVSQSVVEIYSIKKK